jgi:hypothetical protein
MGGHIRMACHCNSEAEQGGGKPHFSQAAVGCSGRKMNSFRLCRFYQICFFRPNASCQKTGETSGMAGFFVGL